VDQNSKVLPRSFKICSKKEYKFQKEPCIHKDFLSIVNFVSFSMQTVRLWLTTMWPWEKYPGKTSLCVTVSALKIHLSP